MHKSRGILDYEKIGVEYQSIDACPNDHIIYYGQYASENKCPQCEISRYRIDKVTKKVPRKVLLYIPIILCFQWIFSYQSITQFMDYHTKNRSEDGVLCMPADGSAMKNIKEKWPIFIDEPRNVRLSLAVDGFNPYGELRSTYSVCHVFVINNNLPPWMSIKRENTMLAMIIPRIFFKVIILFHLFVSLLHENTFYILGHIPK